MHYLKRLVTVFSLGALFTMEMTFNATPPANANEQIQDLNCVLYALGGAAGINLDLVVERTGFMNGPVHGIQAIEDGLEILGLGRPSSRIFYSREELDNYLRSNGNAEYLVAWDSIQTSELGHAINARVIDGRITFIDHQRRCQGSAAEPPRGFVHQYSYWVWLARDVDDVESLTFLFDNLTLDDEHGNLQKRNESFGNFTASCQNINLFTHVDRFHSVHLSAECQDNQGKSTPTAIDLNSNIINSFGALMWQKNGGFGASVQNCKIEVGHYTVLLCDAADGNGSWRKVAINLDTEIENRNGQLTVRDGF
jgi:hypothetical protein